MCFCVKSRHTQGWQITLAVLYWIIHLHQIPWHVSFISSEWKLNIFEPYIGSNVNVHVQSKAQHSAVILFYGDRSEVKVRIRLGRKILSRAKTMLNFQPWPKSVVASLTVSTNMRICNKSFWDWTLLLMSALGWPSSSNDSWMIQVLDPCLVSWSIKPTGEKLIPLFFPLIPSSVSNRQPVLNDSCMWTFGH